MKWCEAGNVGAASVLRLRRCPDEKNIKNLCILLCMVLVFTGVTACARQQEEGNTMADVPASQTESSEKTEADNTEEVY